MLTYAFMLLAVTGASPVDEQVVCAHVSIQIEQRAVMTRTVFKATLKINNDNTGPLEQVLVRLEIKNLQGNSSNQLFGGLTSPTLSSNLTDVDGGGSLQPGETGTAEWLIFPTDLAATTTGPTTYKFGGLVSHLHGGILVTVPLYPVEVDVYPDAKLFLKYYLQSPVYSDSPFTPQIEPSEPFSLGLMVTNDGLGAARNFRITSGQPVITDNPSELLIAFQLIGAQLGLNQVVPSLTLDFGDIEPQQTRVARWLMTSTLQGFFENYDVTFQHVNSLGIDELSLIGGTDIFELNHVVKLEGSDANGFPLYDEEPDFLVNDPPICVCSLRQQRLPCDHSNCDPDVHLDLPSKLHSSHGGSVLPVRLINSARIDGPPTALDLIVNVTVAATEPGWTYIRINDPGAGTSFCPSAVSRVDPEGLRRLNVPIGNSGDIGNAWTTHRFVPITSANPTEVFRIHLLDFIEAPGTYGYTLTYTKSGECGRGGTGENQPPIAICRDAALALPGDSCSRTVNAGEINNGSFDPEGARVTPLIMAVDGARTSPEGVPSVVLSGVGNHVLSLAVRDDQGLLSAPCDANVTLADQTPPTITCAVTTPLLWPADNRLRNVGFSVTATDACTPAPLIQIAVFSDEDDVTSVPTQQYAPDARNIAPSTLRLRRERNILSNGRVYLIGIKATDAAGLYSIAACTVVVPRTQSTASVNSVNAQAAAALAYLLGNVALPPGYKLVGNGPTIGPFQ